MNRPFPRLEVLGLTAALAVAGACTPNTSVKSGAPVLIEMSVVESSAAGPVVTTFTSSAVECPTGAATGGMCDPTAAATCRQTAASNWCQCVANPPAQMPACTDGGLVDAGTPAVDAGTTPATPPRTPPAMQPHRWAAPGTALSFRRIRSLCSCSIGCSTPGRSTLAMPAA